MNFFRRSEIFAALDLGTTNCRLLIARPAGERLRVVDSFSRIVRLGEGLQASGVLSEAAMARTIDALSVCAEKLDQREVTHARFVATEACRQATNCGEFLARVHERTGLDLEIIPMEEEARLALAGCAPLLDPDRPHAVVFDIGGGSTELLWVAISPAADGGIETQIRDVISLPLGVVSLTERFQPRPGDATGPAVFAQMVDTVRDAFADFDRQWGIAQQVAAGGVQMLGSSGTVTTLAGMRLGLQRYERQRVDGTVLDFADIRKITRRLVVMNAAERAREPCIGAIRADLMIAGCAILEAICRTWKVGRLRVADRGVREGILAGLHAATRAGVPDACIRPAALST
ncbi:MAG TPA: Ppx/GppA phosphatase family protein [Aliidongia sp.]|uniref:Ppx/GppA phosphatase family protein n=1 Tax=Aliidongia sp. TaxID=1914230 RepID=UPI002DDCE3CF|nr:Ppx/GppA phosphatase family protein [Aliidongia sp.]HEV2678723.1 Ppx/GppA phosphatase family protein [Aliidongia sp.]